jgi:hypothetical protein
LNFPFMSSVVFLTSCIFIFLEFIQLFYLYPLWVHLVVYLYSLWMNLAVYSYSLWFHHMFMNVFHLIYYLYCSFELKNWDFIPFIINHILC